MEIFLRTSFELIQFTRSFQDVEITLSCIHDRYSDLQDEKFSPLFSLQATSCQLVGHGTSITSVLRNPQTNNRTRISRLLPFAVLLALSQQFSLSRRLPRSVYSTLLIANGLVKTFTRSPREQSSSENNEIAYSNQSILYV